MNKKWILMVLSGVTLVSLPLYSQTPKEETEVSTEGPELQEDPADEGPAIPPSTPRPQNARSKLQHQINPRTLFRLGAKVGVNYSFFKIPGDTLTTGAGYEAMLSGGWDLANQPVFLELESGYKEYRFTGGTETLRIIPIRFGTFYRERFSETSLWKPGIGLSFDFRFIYISAVDSYSWRGVPSVFISQTFEWSAFLMEFLANIHKVGPGDNFVSLASRLGFRF